jgi:FxLD family lantipeptide
MTSLTIEQHGSQEHGVPGDGAADESYDPFGLDIAFIEGTPAAETVLLCSTGDNCGSSCPSACTTS